MAKSLKNAGQQASCPGCHQTLVIPGESELANYRVEQSQKAKDKEAARAQRAKEKEAAKAEEKRKQQEQLSSQQNKAKQPEAAKPKANNPSPNNAPRFSTIEFPLETTWAALWFLLSLISVFAAIITFASVMDDMKDTGKPVLAGLLAASPAVAFAITTGFFGWLTRTFNDVRWLQSEQLKELKIHNKVMENQMRKIVDK